MRNGYNAFTNTGSCVAVSNPKGRSRRFAPTSGSASGYWILPPPTSNTCRKRCGLARPLAALRPRPSPRRALAVVERRAILDLLRAPRFADQAPAEVYAILLDEGVYHCSIRTMYRRPPNCWIGHGGGLLRRRQ